MVGIRVSSCKYHEIGVWRFMLRWHAQEYSTFTCCSFHVRCVIEKKCFYPVILLHAVKLITCALCKSNSDNLFYLVLNFSVTLCVINFLSVSHVLECCQCSFEARAIGTDVNINHL